MAYASKAGRAFTSSTNPRAKGVCQRCGIWYLRSELRPQYDWRGASLANLYIFVCPHCLDTPQEQLRSIVLPADPVPVTFPLVESFVDDEGGNSPVYGLPTGLDANAVMPFDGATQTAYGAPLDLLSVTANGTTTVSVTCRTAHGLSTNDQIAAEGLTNPRATGFYSVTVTSATAFTYTTALAVTAGSLLTGHTRIITALVGLPYGVTTIPQVTS